MTEAGTSANTGPEVTAGTELDGLKLHPDSATATYEKYNYNPGDSRIHIQIDIVANGTKKELIAWYEDNLAAELARRGWATGTINFDATPGDDKTPDVWIKSVKDPDGEDGEGENATFVNVFFYPKSTGAKAPVRIVYQGPMPAR